MRDSGTCYGCMNVDFLNWVTLPSDVTHTHCDVTRESVILHYFMLNSQEIFSSSGVFDLMFL